MIFPPNKNNNAFNHVLTLLYSLSALVTHACRGKLHSEILYHTQDNQLKSLDVARCASIYNFYSYAGTHIVGIYNHCAAWMVDPLRKVCVRTASSGMRIDGKFGTELLLVSIGVGVILWHLKGVTSGPEEVDGLLSLMAVSVDGNFSGTGTWVTPIMGT